MHKYNIYWQRENEKDIMVCKDLEPRVMLARLISAIKNSGPIKIHKVEKC